MHFVRQEELMPYRIMSEFWPSAGPKGLAVTLNFQADGVGHNPSNGEDILIDLQLIEEGAQLEYTQTLYVDNSVSGLNFSISLQVNQQTLTVASGRQAYLPLLAARGVKFVGSTGNQAAAGLITLQFLNVAVPPIVW